jgi:hypothetical protein
MKIRNAAFALIVIVLIALAILVSVVAAYALIAVVVLGVPVMFFADGKSPSSRPGPGASSPHTPGYEGQVLIGDD